MPRRPATVLVATVALLAVSGVAASASGNTSSHSGEAPSRVAAAFGLSPAEQKSKQAALRKCRKITAKKRRQACLRRVEERFRPKPVDPVTPAEVQVRDKYFSPELVEIKRLGAVRWIWGENNADPHNVTLLDGPKGVSPLDFQTPSSPAIGFTFTRTFKVPGTYQFVCSLHHLMRMTVEVGN